MGGWLSGGPNKLIPWCEQRIRNLGKAQDQTVAVKQWARRE